MLSLAICTFNRASSLERTLRSLVGQQIGQELQWELLLVDNNSSDHTKRVVDQYAGPLPIRYFFEAKQGLSHARNKAIKEFRGEVLLFTDDDIRLPDDWVTRFHNAFELNPNAQFFGGRIVPEWSDHKPGWLVDENLALISGMLGSYQIGDKSRVLAPEDPLPFGASFAVRRELISQVGIFRTDLGVKGGSLGRGEETDYLHRSRSAGFHGFYVGDAVCFHQVDYSRLSLPCLYRFGRDKGVSEKLQGNLASASLINELFFGAKGLIQLFKGRGDRFRQCVINMGIQRGLRS